MTKIFRALIQYNVGLGSGRAVGGLGEDAALDLGGVVGCDLALQGGRHEDFTRQNQQLVVGDRLSLREAGHGLVGGDMLFEFPQVQSLEL